jgi:hypothetical protein
MLIEFFILGSTNVVRRIYRVSYIATLNRISCIARGGRAILWELFKVSTKNNFKDLSIIQSVLAWNGCFGAEIHSHPNFQRALMVEKDVSPEHPRNGLVLQNSIPRSS